MYDKHTGFLMPTAIFSLNLTTLRSPSNLLYPCKQRGLHPDGLRRASQPKADPDGSRARCTADRLCNPRCGLGYVITTIGPSWEMGTEQTNILTEERDFLQQYKTVGFHCVNFL